VASFSDPHVRYRRNDQNLGMVGTWNRCPAEARGELIANLCDDDLMLPDRLERQVAIFDAHPETGIVHGDAETRHLTAANISDYGQLLPLPDLLAAAPNPIMKPPGPPEG
jgi:glycosyltransferase involved in cell wall biosynthesis